MKAISKDFWREVKNTRSRFISIMILVALAVAFFSGLRSTAPDMKRTCDEYMDQQNFMDIQVLSTMGLTEEDLEVLLARKEISGGEGAYVIDAFAATARLDAVVKVYSMPEKLNLLTVEEGRLPERINECVVDGALLQKLELSVGDTVVFSSEGEYADALAVRQFTIVGQVTSPYYISGERGTSSLGTGQVSAYVYVPREAFDMDVYTAIYLTVAGAGTEVAFSDGYTELVDGTVETLEPFGEERAQKRHDDLVDEANQVLAEAQQELDDARAEAEAELAKAREELADARRRLDDGWAEVNSAKATLAEKVEEAEAEITTAEQELADSKQALTQGESDYSEGLRQYSEGERAYQEGLREYESGAAEVAAGRAQLEAAYAQLSAAKTQLAEGKKELDANQAQFDLLAEPVLQAVNTRRLTAGKTVYADTDALFTAMADETTGAEVRAEVDAALKGIYEATVLSAEEIVRYLNLMDITVTLEQRTRAGTALTMAYQAAEEELKAQHIYGETTLLLALGAEQAAAAAGQAAGNPVETPLSDAVETILSGVRTGLRLTDENGVPVEPEQVLDSAYLLSAKSQLDAGWSEYHSGMEAVEAGYTEYEEGMRQLEAAESQISGADWQLSAAWAELTAARQELDAARQELDAGWEAYADGVMQLETARETLEAEVASANREISAAVKDLRSGEIEYSDGQREYAAGEAEVREKLSEVEQEMADARRKVAEIEECTWYILTRDSNPGYLGFGQDADRMGNLASVFPVLFFLVAALVCLTTMTRMVEEQRTQIGCLKALGYTRWTISRKYLGYGLLPALLGSAAGLALGYTLFPTMIFVAYQIMYELPNIRLAAYTDISVISVAAAVACTTVSTLAACLATLTDTPANLMRVRAPKPGKRVFLEYIRPLWRRLDFNHKVTARNLFRYQRRFWMTVIGIGGCTALIIAGFGLRSSLLVTMDRQYGEIYHYTAQVAMATSVLEEERADIARAIEGNEAITAALPCHLGAVTAESDRYSATAYLQAVESEEISNFVELKDHKTGEPLTLGKDGVIVTQKLSELLGLAVGDTFVLDGDARVSVRVAGITEHYLSHFVYMTPEYYQQTHGGEYSVNAYLLTFRDETSELCNEIFAELMSINGVASATRMLDTKDTYHSSMERIDFVVVIVILCAAALAVVVLYNLSNINITERQRELATIKLLGFHDGEVSAYVNRENVVLTIVGIVMGVVMGNWLHMWLVRSVEIDLMMFGRETDPWAYVWAAGLTALFSALVNGFGFLKMRKIDMVESLKSAE